MFLHNSITSLFAGTLLSILTIAPSVAQESEPANSEAIDIKKLHHKAAYDLLVIRNDGENLSPSMQSEMRNQIFTIFSKQSDFIILETAYPGILNDLLDNMMPVLLRQVSETMPDLFDRQAKHLVTQLSIKELKEMQRILIAPTFRRIRKASVSNLDLSSIEDAILNDNDLKTDDIASIQTDTVENILPKLSQADSKFLVKISSDPVFIKFLAAKPELDRIEAQWSNEDTPENEAELETIVTNSIENYIANIEESESETIEISDREE